MVDAGQMTTTQIRERLGHASSAVTRRWLSRFKIEAIGRDTESGEKVYDQHDVETAIKAMPIGSIRDRWQGRS